MIHKFVQKRLLKLAILLGVVLLMIGAVHMFIASRIENANNEFSSINNQFMQLKSKEAEISKEQKTRIEAVNFYKNYENSDSSYSSNFTRDAAKARIALMRQEYGLNSLQMSTGTFKELKTQYSTPNSAVLLSSTALKIGANYDVPVFDLIAALEDSLPGIVTINKIELKRQGEADVQTLTAITQGREKDLISADISFNWFGVVDPNAVDPDNGTQALDAGIQNFELKDIPQQDNSPNPIVPPSVPGIR